MNKILLTLITLILSAQLISCTGSQTQDDAEFVDNADVEKIEAEDSSLLDDGSSVASSGEAASENLSTDSSLEAALGETAVETTTETADAIESAGENIADKASDTTEKATDALADASANTELALDDSTKKVEDSLAAAPSLDEAALNLETQVAEEKNNFDVAAPEIPAENPTTDVALNATQTEPTSELNLDNNLDNKLDTKLENTQTTNPELALDTTNSFSADSVPPESPEPTPVDAPVKTKKRRSNKTPSYTNTQVAAAPTPVANKAEKISEMVPYQFEEGYVNTVYIVHPKDKLKDISQMIYGVDKTKELKKINKFLKARAPKAGDKIAYVSPNRPTDSSRTITYFEDNGLVPETYTAQKGDDLKKIAKKLLGYNNAYKEILATNSISSTKLSEGETVRYWKSSSAITPTATTAATNPVNQQEAFANAANQIATNNTPPPPSDLPPPPPDLNQPPTDSNTNLAQGSTDLPPPPPSDLPPPPSDDLNAASNPPSSDATSSPTDASTNASAAATADGTVNPGGEDSGTDLTAGLNEDTYTMMGLGILLCGALAFVLIRRKKAKEAAAMADISMSELGT